jgi:hypothetical protein
MINLNYLIKFLDEKQLKIKKDIYDNINDFEKSDYENVYEEKNKYKVEKYKLDLPNSLNILFNKNIDHFYYDNKYYKNKSPIFTLLNSIFCITDEFFNLNDEYSKEEIIKIFIKKIDDDLFNKNLYNKFNYNKNRKFNKYSIQEVLQNAYFFKYCDKFDLLKEYVSDYLGINIIIFHIENKNLNIENSVYYMTKYYGDNYNKYLPTFLLILENEIYKPLLLKEKDDKETSIIKYSIFNDLIDNIWKIFNIQELKNNDHELKNNDHELKNNDHELKNNDHELKNNDHELKNNDHELKNNDINNKLKNNDINNELKNNEINDEINHELKNNEINNELKNEINNKINNENNNKIFYNIQSLNKMKMDELNELCNKHNISIYKVSEKTSKNIKKLKIELINDLLNI